VYLNNTANRGPSPLIMVNPAGYVVVSHNFKRSSHILAQFRKEENVCIHTQTLCLFLDSLESSLSTSHTMSSAILRFPYASVETRNSIRHLNLISSLFYRVVNASPLDRYVLISNMC